MAHAHRWTRFTKPSQDDHVKKIWLILRVLSPPLYWRLTPFQFRFRISRRAASEDREEARKSGASGALEYMSLIEGATTLLSVTVGELPPGQLSGKGCRFLFREDDLHLMRASEDIIKGF